MILKTALRSAYIYYQEYKIKNKSTHRPNLQKRFRKELGIPPREVCPLFRSSHFPARFLYNI